MIEIKRLSGIGEDTIYNSFSNAFSDYVEPLELSSEQLMYMLQRRGCDLDLSLGAFHGTELVGFTLNGVGDWNSVTTAYDTGTGVIKEYRKKGIATKIFEETLEVLRGNNVQQYLLEVIRTNDTAFLLYKKAGFKVIRELDYYTSSKKGLRFKPKKLNNFLIEEIKTPDWEFMKTFWDFEPSWQNSIDSIKRKLKHFAILGIFKEDELAGYGIIEKHTGDIPQFAISPDYRRSGLATHLFSYLINYSDTDKIKIINTDASYKSFRQFAESINLPSGIGQYEMIRDL